MIQYKEMLFYFYISLGGLAWSRGFLNNKKIIIGLKLQICTAILPLQYGSFVQLDRQRRRETPEVLLRIVLLSLSFLPRFSFFKFFPLNLSL